MLHRLFVMFKFGHIQQCLFGYTKTSTNFTLWSALIGIYSVLLEKESLCAKELILFIRDCFSDWSTEWSIERSFA